MDTFIQEMDIPVNRAMSLELEESLSPICDFIEEKTEASRG